MAYSSRIFGFRDGNFACDPVGEDEDTCGHAEQEEPVGGVGVEDLGGDEAGVPEKDQGNECEEGAEYLHFFFAFVGEPRPSRYSGIVR